MPALSLSVVLTFLASIVLQVAALSMLPQTAGFTKLWPTVACIVPFVAGIALLARIAASGVQLSILIPLSAAAVPLAIVAVGIFAYGEPASLLRVAILVVACVLIGVASSI
ncbi:MAG: SMR family transporter [Dehalococcoidia bacterium]